MVAGRLGQGLDEPRPAAPDLHREPAPELVAPVHLERLAPVGGAEAHPVAPHPAKGLEAAVDEGLGEVRVGAPLGEAPEVVEVLLAGVGAEFDVPPLVLGEVRHELHEVVHPAEDEPHRPRRVAAVAARLLLRGPLEHGHPRPLLARRERRAERRVACAHYNDVRIALFHGRSFPRVRPAKARSYRKPGTARRRNPTFPAHEVRVACVVGLRFANPTYNPAATATAGPGLGARGARD